MDFIKYTFALLVFAWATVTPDLDTAPLEFTPPVYETVDTAFIDLKKISWTSTAKKVLKVYDKLVC